MRDFISVRRFLPIASEWGQLGKYFWETRSNAQKQTAAYTHTHTHTHTHEEHQGNSQPPSPFLFLNVSGSIHNVKRYYTPFRKENVNTKQLQKALQLLLFWKKFKLWQTIRGYFTLPLTIMVEALGSLVHFSHYTLLTVFHLQRWKSHFKNLKLHQSN